MIKLIHKLSGLLLLGLFSLQVAANSPWAETEATAASNTMQDEPVVQVDNPRPAIDDEIAESKAAEKAEPAAEPRLVKTEVIKQGDIVNMPQASTAAVHLLDFPRRGMTTDKVENELGRPSEIIPAIGQPPISRWVYDDRTVYFEYSSVIHVVSK